MVRECRRCFIWTEAIASDESTRKKYCADHGRKIFRGIQGLVIGQVCRRLRGGPIAFLETDDLILLDIEERKLEIIGVKGQKLAEEEIEKILEERKRAWIPKERKI